MADQSNYINDQGLSKFVGTNVATAVAGAATLNAFAGQVTSESLATAAGATYTLTLTNSKISASDLVFVSVDKAASTGTPALAYATPGAGSVVIVIQNINGATAFNSSIKIAFIVMKTQ